MTNTQPLLGDNFDLLLKQQMSSRSEDVPLTVSQISQKIKSNLEKTFAKIRVQGELLGVTCRDREKGHIYFSLKDDNASLSCVIWSGLKRLDFPLKDGDKVVCVGNISSYPAGSRYQLIVTEIIPDGEGAILRMLEERRKKLEKEGLFAAERKKSLPRFPKVVGVITSPTGDVINDITNRLRDRFPLPVLLWPVAVQGTNCAKQVVTAIEGFNKIPPEGLDTPTGHIARPDVLIVARGGGSLEDLLPFSEEIVVRAVANSEIPLISAVGHDPDWMLIDFAADVRAPTPTGAAEMLSRNKDELILQIQKYIPHMYQYVTSIISHYKDVMRNIKVFSLEQIVNEKEQRLDDRFDMLKNKLENKLLAKINELNKQHLKAPTELISLCERRLIEKSFPLERVLEKKIQELTSKFELQSKLLDSYSYQRILDRGFAVVTDKSGVLVSNKELAQKQEELNVQFADGILQVFTKQQKSFDKKKKSSKREIEDSNQGLLL